jgi:GNAT superfamily N-acetyltransferase
VLVLLAESDSQILGCFPVISQLRPHIKQAKFVEQVRYQMEEGYKLAFLQNEEQTVAVGGFRISSCLASGRFLYIDDFVVDQLKRSQGYGQYLFQWLIEYAQNHQCQYLTLDSGVQRFEAHRFYLMQRLSITSHHFSMKL